MLQRSSMAGPSLCMLPGVEWKFPRSPAPCPFPGILQCWQLTECRSHSCCTCGRGSALSPCWGCGPWRSPCRSVSGCTVWGSCSAPGCPPLLRLGADTHWHSHNLRLPPWGTQPAPRCPPTATPTQRVVSTLDVHIRGADGLIACREAEGWEQGSLARFCPLVLTHSLGGSGAGCTGNGDE